MDIASVVFWAGVFVALGFALFDATRRPWHAREAWKRFRLVAAAIVIAAIAFFVINLVRFGFAHAGWLLSWTVYLFTVAALATAFFCGGRFWVAHAGYVGLFERIWRTRAGLPAPSVWRSVGETAALPAVFLGFSIPLFLLTQPDSPIVEQFEAPGNMEIRSGYLYLVILVAPIWEEVAFRWYLLNRLEAALGGFRWGRLAAIVASSALWACGHAAWTDPAWVKLVQIFVAGCLLAWRFRVIGLSGSILAHLTLNLPAILLQSST